jgi:hypothetical protein
MVRKKQSRLKRGRTGHPQISRKTLEARAHFISGGRTPSVWATRIPEGEELIEIFGFMVNAEQNPANAAKQLLRAIKEADSKRSGPSTEETWPQSTKALRWYGASDGQARTRCEGQVAMFARNSGTNDSAESA